jgi:hypothetical protein
MGGNIEFSMRLAEVLGSSKPAHLQRLLNIPYQSAKNYLNGRVPGASVLITLSDRTDCSIDWLLTGRGKKFISDESDTGAPISAGQFERSVRRICVEVINELNAEDNAAQPKTIRLQSSELMSEKVPAEPAASPVRRR